MESRPAVAPPPVRKPLRLRPFRGLRVAPGRIGRHEAPSMNRPYRALAEQLAQWQTEGRLEHDPEPAVYLHEYTMGGITVRGLVGALDLTATSAADEPAVVPHEGVHLPQVTDLAGRMRQMHLNPAPILLVHRGPARIRRLIGEAIARPPHWAFTDRARQRHRIWRIDTPADLSLIDAELEDAQALIADGHHRYAAYLQLREEHPGTAWQRGLAMLVDQQDTPLFVGAVHRRLHQASLTEVIDITGESETLTAQPLQPAEALSALTPDAAVVTDGHQWWSVAGIAQPDRTQVEVVHQELIDPLLSDGTGISYHHSAHDLLDAVHRHGGVAVLLPSTDLDQVLAASLVRLLPEKATSFQPKPSVGVLMRSLDDETPGG